MNIFRTCVKFLCIALVWASSNSASAQIWETVSAKATEDLSQTTHSKVSNSMDWAREVRTDNASLEYILNQSPHERLGSSGATIDLPLPDGGAATFALVYSPIMASELEQKQPDFQTYLVTDIANPQNVGRLDVTSRGFHGMFKHNGELVFIDPSTTPDTFYTYYESDHALKTGVGASHDTTCTAGQHLDNKLTSATNGNILGWNSDEKTSFGADIRTYRIAVAATGGYTQYFGGTKEEGLSAIVTAINRLNVIFETEMAIRFEIVANNDLVVFTDPDTDPFTQTSRYTMLDEVRGVLNNEIGAENFDIGHVFGKFGGGVAYTGVVCGSRKAQGVSGTSRPHQPRFILLLAHEVAHQFNAPHSFNGKKGSCGSGWREKGAFEPHSGSTIMSYLGLCGFQDLKGEKSSFFHNSSLTFMNDFVENQTKGGKCPVLVANSNTAPEVHAGPDGAIPISTPFILTGQATDADGDALTHIWEQLDKGARNEDKDDFEDDGARPLFRSFLPSTSSSRTFPKIGQVLQGNYVIGEVYPTQDRDLTFRMTTRDGKGGVTDDERILRVSAAAGPFIIETPANETLDGGMPYTVNWDVANTTADPVNCDMVRLSLSTDGGNTFDHELAKMTENDGSATIDLPNMATTSARLRAECTSQPFFDINDKNFTITKSIIVNAPPVANNDSISVEEDSLRTQIDVLANDSDPEGDVLALASVVNLSGGGKAELVGGGVEYSPEPGFIGTETFNYVIDDGNENTATGTVTVTVTPKPNVAPTAADDNLTVDQDSSAARIDVLANDTDPDGDTLKIQSLGNPSNGGTAIIDVGQVAYTPAAGVNGTETFTYVSSDGEGGTATGTVTVTITAAPPAPNPTQPAPPPVNTLASGGGGSFGPFLLLLLAIRNGIANRREKRC